jgi:prepilin peptidase CpaA
MWDSLWQHGMPLVQWGVVLGASLTAAVTDVSSRRIPNLLTGPMFAAGLVYAVAAAGLAGLGDSLVAAVLLAVPYVLLYALAGGGAGDAKMMAAVGAWLGVINGLAALVGVSLAGVVMGLAMAAWRRGLRLAFSRVWYGSLRMVANVQGGGLPGMAEAASGKMRMPYGLAICAGCWLAGAGVLIWRYQT